jgi:hypothetical protein
MPAARRDCPPARDELVSCGGTTAGWKWRSSSLSGPRPTSPGRRCSQNRVPAAGPRARGRPLYRRGGLPGPGRVTLGLLEWLQRGPSARDLENAYLANTIVDIHTMSRGSYSAPLVHAELRLGMDVRVGRKQLARLLTIAGRRGIGHRHQWRHRPAEAVHQGLVQRKFVADASGPLWCTDITEHPDSARKVCCRAVLDACSRTVVGLVDVRPHALGMVSTPCRWPSGGADPRPAPSFIRTRTVVHQLGLRAGCAMPDRSDPWDGPPRAWTTR